LLCQKKEGFDLINLRRAKGRKGGRRGCKEREYMIWNNREKKKRKIYIKIKI